MFLILRFSICKNGRYISWNFLGLETCIYIAREENWKIVPSNPRTEMQSSLDNPNGFPHQLPSVNIPINDVSINDVPINDVPIRPKEILYLSNESYCVSDPSICAPNEQVHITNSGGCSPKIFIPSIVSGKEWIVKNLLCPVVTSD
ncbi:hypothetical protein CEXT_78211 [Caerostris extrusa]|uniref:Uncharacterized protein n=1 Tax=Caerostris extrusa TaxID=172846 RepID=A0AAV4QEQ9_CAEEX|nr:hypothetical protein CEXT_78211 [Caerostris extrusa]